MIQAKGARTPGHQAAGDRVGLVARLSDHLLHALTRRQRNIRPIVNHPRDYLNRDGCLARDAPDGDEFLPSHKALTYVVNVPGNVHNTA